MTPPASASRCDYICQRVATRIICQRVAVRLSGRGQQYDYVSQGSSTVRGWQYGCLAEGNITALVAATFETIRTVLTSILVRPWGLSGLVLISSGVCFMQKIYF